MEAHEPTPLVLFCAKVWRRFVKLLGRAAKNNAFRYVYATLAVVVFAGSAVFWTALGARLQVSNADQLSDPYLFSSWSVFHGATFPGSHTFLLKWPIFLLLHFVGITSANLLYATVGVVVVTLAVLLFVLYKIDRRPLVFGTVCLGLAFILLLVPAQPYAGGLLPVNMAMLTTRNLEYAFYIGALILFARANRIRSRSFMTGVVLLALLVATDKLFLSLSAGGAVISLMAYALFRNRGLSAHALRWLTGSILAGVLAVVLLFAVSATHLTHLTSATTATPYGAARSSTDLALGISYAVLGFFTNLGANPVYDNKILSELPRDIGSRLWSISNLAYLAAAILAVYALVWVWRMVRPSLKSDAHQPKPPVANLLALSLIWSTVIAFGVFIVSNHYYAVDARYLTIGFFALAVSLSVGLRRQRWRWPEDLLLIACSLAVLIALAAVTALHIHTQQAQALDAINERNTTIAATLKHHKVDVLVGDYWRVLPIKLDMGSTQNIMPLRGCTDPGVVLTSSAWHPDLRKHSFAYLVTLDGSITDFPNCSLKEITSKYGRPNATQIISGTLARPAEALLFYDQGSRSPTKIDAQSAQAPLVPIGLQDIENATCDQQTVMNVVAHQDDDLLFLNPDMLHEIQSGQCVRTIFLTAGDSGYDKLYWLSRQLGSEAAYAHMLGLSPNTAWNQQTVKLGSGKYATIASPLGSTKVSLVFLNLPDGDLWGQGFSASGSQSLAKLHDGRIQTITSVDRESTYTSDQLTTTLAELMTTYQPAEIHTQADVPSDRYPDHSDHVTAGQYAQAAATLYDQIHFGDALAVPVTRYIGYPTHGYRANISGDDLAQKEATFLVYAAYDGGVCHSLEECAQTPTYGAYLSREYTEDGNEQ